MYVTNVPIFLIQRVLDGHLEYSVPIHLIVVAYSLSRFARLDVQFDKYVTNPDKLRSSIIDSMSGVCNDLSSNASSN